MIIRFIFICLFLIGSVNAQDTTNTVMAQKGDGIFSILRKQGVPSSYYREFIVLNKEKLTDSLKLIEGKTYFLPFYKDTLSVAPKKIDSIAKKTIKAATSIFGKGHETINVKSNKLEKAIYYLVSGHGGPDPGAMGVYNNKDLAEDEYAYDVTLRLAKELLSHGAQVELIVQDPNDGIRDKRILEIDRDEVVIPNLTIPLNQSARLKQRVNAVNKLYKKNKGSYQRLIVIHIDSRSKGKNIDVFFYHHRTSKSGKKLAENIHLTFQQKYKKYQPNRTYTGTFEDRSSLYVVKKTFPAMAFIELGNIRNKKDLKRILDPDNRQALAKWISEGLLLDFENNPSL